MSFFTQKDISSEEVKVNGEICKDGKNHFDKLEKSYSTDSADGLTTLQNAEICIDLTIYRSLVQFQIILSVGSFKSYNVLFMYYIIIRWALENREHIL